MAMEVVGSIHPRATVRSVPWPWEMSSGEARKVSKGEMCLEGLSDEDLMVRFAQGDHVSFEILLGRYRQPLFGFLFRFLGCRYKAEDVFQEVFFDVIRAKRKYRPGLKFSAWLFRIARNRAVDRFRRDAWREMHSLDDTMEDESGDGDGLVGRVACKQPDPEHVAMDRELAKALEAAMGSLPREQREVLWLKETSGLSLAEIAKVVGVPENTVKSRLRYALEKIRTDLIKQGFKP